MPFVAPATARRTLAGVLDVVSSIRFHGAHHCGCRYSRPEVL